MPETHLTLPLLPLFLAVSVAAGFLNTVAGGGSLLTWPIFIFLGMPPQVANGTIRVTVFLQNLVAVPAYAREGAFLPRESLLLGTVAVPAAFLGSLAAARLDPAPFSDISAILLLAVLATVFLNPRAWLRAKGEEAIHWRRVLPWMALVGFYGGFFQIGVGVPFLAAAVLAGGWDLLSANSLKVTVVLLYTVIPVVVFAKHGQIDWVAGIVLGLGHAVGAILGARSAARQGPGWVRWVLVATVIAAVAKMAWDRFGG